MNSSKDDGPAWDLLTPRARWILCVHTASREPRDPRAAVDPFSSAKPREGSVRVPPRGKPAISFTFPGAHGAQNPASLSPGSTRRGNGWLSLLPEGPAGRSRSAALRRNGGSLEGPHQRNGSGELGFRAFASPILRPTGEPAPRWRRESPGPRRRAIPGAGSARLPARTSPIFSRKRTRPETKPGKRSPVTTLVSMNSASRSCRAVGAPTRTGRRSRTGLPCATAVGIGRKTGGRCS